MRYDVELECSTTRVEAMAKIARRIEYESREWSMDWRIFKESPERWLWMIA